MRVILQLCWRSVPILQCKLKCTLIYLQNKVFPTVVTSFHDLLCWSCGENWNARAKWSESSREVMLDERLNWQAKNCCPAVWNDRDFQAGGVLEGLPGLRGCAVLASKLTVNTDGKLLSTQSSVDSNLQIQYHSGQRWMLQHLDGWAF